MLYVITKSDIILPKTWDKIRYCKRSRVHRITDFLVLEQKGLTQHPVKKLNPNHQCRMPQCLLCRLLLANTQIRPHGRKGRHINCPFIGLITDGGEETVFFSIVFAPDTDEDLNETEALSSSSLGLLLRFQFRSEHPISPYHM